MLRGEVKDPNYTIDEKGKLVYIGSTFLCACTYGVTVISLPSVCVCVSSVCIAERQREEGTETVAPKRRQGRPRGTGAAAAAGYDRQLVDIRTILD